MSDIKPHLILAIDAGASSIKAVGSLAGDTECVPVTLEPYCVEVADKPASNLEFDENSVWVAVDELNYAVGNLAVAKYDAGLSIKPAKTETIIPKICAVIAVFRQKFNLPAKFDLSIVSVLPPGEFAWKDEFAEVLRLTLRRPIVTPAGAIKAKVVGVSIHPEGFGIMTWHRTIGVAKTRDCAVIMMGFRNTSVIFSRKGQVTNCKSSNHGFYSVLEKVASKGGGNYSERDLIVPVWKYLIDKDESGFRKIAISNDLDSEMRMIRPVIELAITEYRRNVESWLRENMVATDLVVVCGGNAEYTFDMLKPFLEKYAEEVPGAGYLVRKHIGNSSIPQTLIDTGMPTRFLDIYCLWLDLNSNFKKAN